MRDEHIHYSMKINTKTGEHSLAPLDNELCDICGLHGKGHDCEAEHSSAPSPGYLSGSLEFNPIELNAQGFRAEIQPNGDVWITDRVKQYKPEGGPEVVSVRDGDTIVIPKDKCKELSSLLGRDEMRDAIVIGQYEIRHWDANSFWIEHESGEGMQCPAAKLADCIDVFYKENF